jgi:hypothetical protein
MQDFTHPTPNLYILGLLGFPPLPFQVLPEREGLLSHHPHPLHACSHEDIHTYAEGRIKPDFAFMLRAC